MGRRCLPGTRPWAGDRSTGPQEAPGAMFASAGSPSRPCASLHQRAAGRLLALCCSCCGASSPATIRFNHQRRNDHAHEDQLSVARKLGTAELRQPVCQLRRRVRGRLGAAAQRHRRLPAARAQRLCCMPPGRAARTGPATERRSLTQRHCQRPAMPNRPPSQDRLPMPGLRTATAIGNRAMATSRPRSK